MSTFYLLPPRPMLGRRFGEFLAKVFPGLTWNSAAWVDLAESLGATAEASADVYVVYREDLPAGEDAQQILVQAFGAEPGDEVVEVQAPGSSAEAVARRWQLK
jgi:hypothetical protein